MADLSLQSIIAQAAAGLAPTYAAATAGGDAFVNDGRTFLQVKNGSGSPITVTVTPPVLSANVPAFGTMAKAPVVVSVPATTGDRMIGPFPPAAFNDVNGKVQVTYSGVTTLTVGAFKLPATD